MKVTRIEFEDQGQDFLTWDIDKDGVVIDCKPFQARFWCGGIVENKEILVGDHITYVRNLTAFLEDDPDSFITIKYPVVKVEHIDVSVQDENQLNYWGDLFEKHDLKKKLGVSFDVFMSLPLDEKQVLLKEAKLAIYLKRFFPNK